MKKNLKTSRKNKFPQGWDETRVRRVLDHYERQTDEAAAAEDDALFSKPKHTLMQIPVKLVPAVRRLLNKKAS
jgi:hypothetical protein